MASPAARPEFHSSRSRDRKNARTFRPQDYHRQSTNVHAAAMSSQTHSFTEEGTRQLPLERGLQVKRLNVAVEKAAVGKG